MRVKKFVIALVLKETIGGINAILIESISEQIGIKSSVITEISQKNFPHSSIDAFMSNYFETTFYGREQCREFEEATATIFREIFKFNSTWLGSASSSRTVPDILLTVMNVTFKLSLIPKRTKNTIYQQLIVTE